MSFALPSDWGTYGATQKINWFNENQVDVDTLLGQGVDQASIDWMLANGYLGTYAAPAPAPYVAPTYNTLATEQEMEDYYDPYAADETFLQQIVASAPAPTTALEPYVEPAPAPAPVVAAPAPYVAPTPAPAPVTSSTYNTLATEASLEDSYDPYAASEQDLLNIVGGTAPAVAAPAAAPVAQTSTWTGTGGIGGDLSSLPVTAPKNDFQSAVLPFLSQGVQNIAGTIYQPQYEQISSGSGEEGGRYEQGALQNVLRYKEGQTAPGQTYEILDPVTGQVTGTGKFKEAGNAWDLIKSAATDLAPLATFALGVGPLGGMLGSTVAGALGIPVATATSAGLTAAQVAALGSAAGSAGLTALQGGSLEDVLKSAVPGALSGFVLPEVKSIVGNALPDSITGNAIVDDAIAKGAQDLAVAAVKAGVTGQDLDLTKTLLPAITGGIADEFGLNREQERLLNAGLNIVAGSPVTVSSLLNVASAIAPTTTAKTSADPTLDKLIESLAPTSQPLPPGSDNIDSQLADWAQLGTATDETSDRLAAINANAPTLDTLGRDTSNDILLAGDSNVFTISGVPIGAWNASSIAPNFVPPSGMRLATVAEFEDPNSGARYDAESNAWLIQDTAKAADQTLNITGAKQQTNTGGFDFLDDIVSTLTQDDLVKIIQNVPTTPTGPTASSTPADQIVTTTGSVFDAPPTTLDELLTVIAPPPLPPPDQIFEVVGTRTPEVVAQTPQPPPISELERILFEDANIMPEPEQRYEVTAPIPAPYFPEFEEPLLTTEPPTQQVEVKQALPVTEAPVLDVPVEIVEPPALPPEQVVEITGTKPEAPIIPLDDIPEIVFPEIVEPPLPPLPPDQVIDVTGTKRPEINVPALEDVPEVIAPPVVAPPIPTTPAITPSTTPATTPATTPKQPARPTYDPLLLLLLGMASTPQEREQILKDYRPDMPDSPFGSLFDEQPTTEDDLLRILRG